jgi:hypothetical protein
VGSRNISTPFVIFCLLSHFSGILVNYFIFFSIILIDKIFLWNILEIKISYLVCDIFC